MVAEDYKYFQIGAQHYPLTPDTTNSLLQDGDPSVFALLNFIKGVLQINAGGRWTNAVTALGLNNNTNTQTNYQNIVNSCVSYDPYPCLQQGQYKYPLLAVYRGDARFKEFTVNHHRIETDLNVEYYLPPLEPGQLAKLFPILNVVQSIITSRLMLGFDPAYLNGFVISGTDGAYIDQIQLNKSKMDSLIIKHPNIQGESPVYRFLSMQMVIKERDLVPDLGFEALAGMDGYIDTVYDGYQPFDMVRFKIDQ